MRLELTAHLVEIAIEYAFWGQKSSFCAILLNRMRKFALDLNCVRPKKSFWKIECANCIKADTVCMTHDTMTYVYQISALQRVFNVFPYTSIRIYFMQS